MKVGRSILEEKLFLSVELSTAAYCCALWAALNSSACTSVSVTGSISLHNDDTEKANSGPRAEQRNLNTSISKIKKKTKLSFHSCLFRIAVQDRCLWTVFPYCASTVVTGD